MPSLPTLAAMFALCLAPASFAAAQSLSLLHDAEGVRVGEFVERQGGSWPWPGVVVHSERGFRFALAHESADLVPLEMDVSGVAFDTELLFANQQCAGTAYVAASSQRAAGGVVIPTVSGHYYVPKAPMIQVVLVASARTANGCSTVAPIAVQAAAAFPNDPSITGVPDLLFIPPLRLEPVPLSLLQGLFRDGFESSLLSAPDHDTLGVAHC